MSKLFQLHWQYKNGTTEMRAQREINSHKEMKTFLEETQEAHPLPDGAIWMACNKTSKHFVFTELKSDPFSQLWGDDIDG